MNWLTLSKDYVNMDLLSRVWYDSHTGDIVLTFADASQEDLRYPALGKDADAVRMWMKTHAENPGNFNDLRLPPRPGR